MKKFDFDKAAQLILDHPPQNVMAGMVEDWFWTSDFIFKDGKPNLKHGAYLTSTWATPVIRFCDEDVTEECWCDDLDDDLIDHSWPESALRILETKVIEIRRNYET